MAHPAPPVLEETVGAKFNAFWINQGGGVFNLAAEKGELMRRFSEHRGVFSVEPFLTLAQANGFLC